MNTEKTFLADHRSTFGNLPHRCFEAAICFKALSCLSDSDTPRLIFLGKWRVYKRASTSYRKDIISSWKILRK
jgi:hypothetical protein